MKPFGGWKRYGRFYPLSPAYDLPIGKYYNEMHSSWPYEEFDASANAVHRLFGKAVDVDPRNWRLDPYKDEAPHREKAWRGIETVIPYSINRRERVLKPRNPMKFSSYGQRIYMTALCGHTVSVYSAHQNRDSRKLHIARRKCIYCYVDEWTEEVKLKDPVARLLKAMKGNI